MNKAISFIAKILILPAILAGCSISPQRMDMKNPFGKVGIRNGWFTIDGEPFLVVGVGYEIGARPGRLPWARDFEPELLHNDFRRIREAGFNTIRCWAPMTDSELGIAADYGLWVIQGLWIDPKGDFADPAFRKKCFDQLEREITRLSRHPNILGYLLMNEPHGEAVYHAGIETMERFFQDLAGIVQKIDPDRPFSYSNCVFTDFIRPSMFSFVAQNVYPYSPDTIRRALGYRTYLEILKNRFAPDKPFIVTEFGLSVSEKGDGRGYGGNTLEEQSEGVISMWKDILASGAAGGCAFMWIDGWWKGGDENTHNNNPEEWYGLLEADSGYIGRPRPVYHALKEFNSAIRVTPVPGGIYGDAIPLSVWGPDCERIQYKIDNGPWSNIQKKGPWARVTIDAKSLPEGRHEIQTRGIDHGDTPVGLKKARIEISHNRELDADPLNVTIGILKDRIDAGERIELEIQVTDSRRQPVPGIPVHVEQFCHTKWNEAGTDTVTDERGHATCHLPGFPEPAILSIAAGVEYSGGGMTRRYGDYKHVIVH